MSLRGYAAGALTVLGGLLMLESGYASRGLLYTALGYALPRLPDLLGGEALSVAEVAIAILEVMIALGGLTVVLGGLAILLGHAATGRILIYLGGGAGFLGLLVSFGYSAYKLGGLDPVLAYLPYWVGLAMAVAGRRLSRQT